MRILLADNQPNVMFALRALLGRRPGWEIIGEVADPEALLSLTQELRPDVVLLDWSLARFLPSDSLSILREIHPDVYVVALSARPEASGPALAGGADAFVSKVDSPEHLLSVLEDRARTRQVNDLGDSARFDDSLRRR